jgi:DNA-binding Lrp family transcriptional regulator
MHLVDTPVNGIAEALRMAPNDVRRRIEAMLRRLARGVVAPPGTVAT